MTNRRMIFRTVTFTFKTRVRVNINDTDATIIDKAIPDIKEIISKANLNNHASLGKLKQQK